MASYFRVYRIASLATVILTASSLYAQQQPRDDLREPVFRIANANNIGDVNAASQHPLDPAIEIAQRSLAHVQANIADYDAILVKRELVGGALTDHEYILTKVRNRKVVNGQVQVPFSVYMRFLKPASVKGREVLYVEGWNNNKLMAREAGLLGKATGAVSLNPNGILAMRGNRYPITEVGIENLLVRLIEKGVRDRQHGECSVNFYDNFKINGRACTKLVVTHPVRRDYFDFHIAEVFLDKELNIPIRYAAYDWPAQPDGEPSLIEEYTYLKLNLNVGLTDADFDSKNPNYSFN